jgi:TolB protein
MMCKQGIKCGAARAVRSTPCNFSRALLAMSGRMLESLTLMLYFAKVPSQNARPPMRHPSVHFLAAISTLCILLGEPGMNSYSQQKQIGLFEGQTDIGSPLHAGSASYDSASQSYTIEGSGSNMWFGRDEFHFLWRKLKGDFVLSAQVRFVGKGVEQHRKLGWIVRSGLEPGSPHANASLHGDGLMSLQFRRKEGDTTREVQSSVRDPDVIHLERKGNSFIMSVAKFGDTLSTSEITDLALSDEIYAGLYVCAHNKDVVEKALFHNVRIVIPPKQGFVPYRDFIGSDLEIMDVETGVREVLYHSSESLQAPNWTKDGKALMYNRNGHLYRFDLSRPAPLLLNTGFATANNNDHVLSFDGTKIGISHHSARDGNKSIIYTLPIKGGNPRRITRNGPSYLHGWSPDGKSLVYTGERNGEFDIYRISSRGGKEVRLTNARGLDDGPEYSPDGDYIYFNSNRGGTMQIWRMKPDGTGQEQLTNDSYNNWFPHVSPDGRWIVFLTFGGDVSPGDHPFYKQVYLRLMPAGGGQPTIIAYVFGGQGTMNVPSWSPDGKKIAFVSNTDLKE